jgi:hypothetical protein
MKLRKIGGQLQVLGTNAAMKILLQKTAKPAENGGE